MIFRDFFLSGIVIATALWYVLLPKPVALQLTCPRFVSNRLLLSPPSHSTPADSFVEWAYVFDVHTNAFFPFYLTLYLAQLFLLPIVLKGNWVCLWLGNTLYLAAYVSECPCPYTDAELPNSFAQYTYGIYLGLSGEWVGPMTNRGLTERSIAFSHTVRAAANAAASTFHCIYTVAVGIQCCETCVVCILWAIK